MNTRRRIGTVLGLVLVSVLVSSGLASAQAKTYLPLIMGGKSITFVSRDSGLDSTWSEDIALGDLDGDGDLDAFSVNQGADKVWMNRGNATFVFSGQNLGEEWNTGVALGDVDDDGDRDAVTSAYNSKPSLWINQN